MPEEEEDFSSLPFPDRFAHKNWKVRRGGYEDAAKAFQASPDESDPVFRQFILDPGLWKGAVLDSNVAAQQEGINALCAFLKLGGPQACTRSRNATITPLVEKGLPAAKAATKQSSLEALMLYVELDKADPILEDLLQGLSNKQPKIIASTIAALTALYHAYGVKIVDPKPALKALPRAFGHADKSVRAEASTLAVELYRWLREAMKALFWEELKPVQQQDLEKLFEGVKSQPPPKQERLLRTQQAAKEKAGAALEEDDAAEDKGAEDGQGEAKTVELLQPVDVLSELPPDFHDKMASTKWKERKEALDALHDVANTPRVKDGHYDEVLAALAKAMKDANIAVVTVAANCVDVLAKGLQRSFAKYRGKIMSPILERLKEKKQSVADALGQALDSIVLSTSLSECLEDILEFLKHKNPQVKAETLKLLIRSLKSTRVAPSKPEAKSIADAATKLLTESTEATRSGGAEVLGTLMKIMGERAMAPYMEGLDDIRKAKIKEYHDAAQVKAKDKPKAAPPPTKAAPIAQKRPTATKKPAPGLKAPVKRASTPQAEKPSSPAPKPAASKPIPSKLGSLPKSGLAGPSAGVKKKLPGAGPPPTLQSPRRTITPHSEEESVPAPKVGRGLAGRPLGKPTPAVSATAPASPPAAHPGLNAADRAEIEFLRGDKDRLLRTNDDLRTQTSKLTSQVHELQNQNAQLIEDHTRDVLSIKAKETQLVRARSDAEAAESMVQRLQRENERLKRELSRTVRQSAASPLSSEDQIYRDSSANSASTYAQNPSLERYDSHRSERGRSYIASPSEEKENGNLLDGIGGKKERQGVSRGNSVSGQEVDESGKPVENWKRAAEVTSQLKARIEQMKAKQGLARQR
ncbi:MAG: hypothetical protein Q9163_001823 [Psora crenata]